jgi:cystathionine gamma-synthase
LAALARAVKPGATRLVWLETPSNPLWGVSDIEAAARIAHTAGAALAVDSTCATPILTRPIALGADVVMHSATKYLNGHSDVIAGALSFARDDELCARARKIRHAHGLILHPLEAFLLTRGLRTLDLRVRAACMNAIELANRLSNHAAVSAVLYPGLAHHPGHEVARRQMKGGFGGMLSIRVRGGPEAAIAAAARVGLWKRATSLGGVESLIEHRASIEGAGSPCPPDLLRLSAGVEDVEDLWRDIDAALSG